MFISSGEKWLVMANMTTKDKKLRTPLAEILELCPEIRPKIDPGLASRQSTRIDHIISLVEDARGKRPHSSELDNAYRILRREYPAHFEMPENNTPTNTFQKPNSYKALGN